MTEITDEMLEDALAMNAVFDEARDPDAMAERVAAVAERVAAENEAAPSEEEVAALYVLAPDPADAAPEPDGVPLEVFIARAQHAAGEIGEDRLQAITDGAMARAEVDLRLAEERQAVDANPAVAELGAVPAADQGA